VHQHGTALSAVPSSTTSEGAGGRLFYTLREAAALLQISEGTYYRGLREGELPGRKIVGQWRIPCDALHRYAEGATASPGREAP
jgi:excisionase family DNA binding protein